MWQPTPVQVTLYPGGRNKEAAPCTGRSCSLARHRLLWGHWDEIAPGLCVAKMEGDHRCPLPSPDPWPMCLHQHRRCNLLALGLALASPMYYGAAGAAVHASQPIRACMSLRAAARPVPEPRERLAGLAPDRAPGNTTRPSRWPALAAARRRTGCISVQRLKECAVSLDRVFRRHRSAACHPHGFRFPRVIQ